MTDALNALRRYSDIRAQAMGITFGIRTLRLDWQPYEDEDVFTMCLSVRETVETITLEQTGWYWTDSVAFFDELEGLREDLGTREELFPHLKSFSVRLNQYKKWISVSRGEEGFVLFLGSPRKWWAEVEAEANREEQEGK
ncbi:hypothetical protein DFP72DRAFT_1063380 [Ephemerocybe angulata]|uniref:Uncharacterized protein n=1 Tax=Ephemerocybe angulata TaxID=980116 RepID=A0A8H6MDS5_9AGAR|nr:hypothetical protein DFP72DRAFT_1063380 [Tulosesus angulatus]